MVVVPGKSLYEKNVSALDQSMATPMAVPDIKSKRIKQNFHDL